MARVIPEGGDPYYDTFDMSGAGSPRYMAPECLDEDEYNMKADVYTFALVFWEMLTGQMPYSFLHTWDHLFYYVVEGSGRPEINEEWPARIQGMLASSFDADVAKRPVSSKELLGSALVWKHLHCCSHIIIYFSKENATVLQGHLERVDIFARR